MKWPWQKTEQRSLENPQVNISNAEIINFLGLSGDTVSGESVTIETALGVPAVWAAVNFLSWTMAALPLHTYRKRDDNRERITGGLADVLGKSVSDDMTSFDWRKYSYEQMLTGGRAFTFIERNGRGEVINLHPLPPEFVKVRRSGGKKEYIYNENGRTHVYKAGEVIDLPFMLKSDLLSHRSPISSHKESIAKALAITKYGAKIFGNGGVPPFALVGPFQSREATDRAQSDLAAAIVKASKENRSVLPLPTGHEIKTLGADPEKMQMTEDQRFLIEEIARIYGLPPVFLQDLTHGTYNNTEQQDLNLVKHRLRSLVVQAESQLNLKLFGRNSDYFVEFSLDGLLRGDIKSRYEAYAKGIQNGFMEPNRARTMENWPKMDGLADDLFIQGASVPLDQQGVIQNETDENEAQE
ncbi:MAG: phage portal protein [Kordiimonas sp.]|nr:phage portal protein [Kordiimonas sp.]|tara:strand:+ start:692 stop:1927 length:1236 start_codon:yes stop_codon:yes gene_type:complete